MLGNAKDAKRVFLSSFHTSSASTATSLVTLGNFVSESCGAIFLVLYLSQRIKNVMKTA